MEKISVVIPAYNAENTIEKAVLSAWEQTGPEKEILVVDDGSTDGTPALLCTLQEKIPELKVIRQENSGVSAARNAGIGAAAGRWLVTLDDDDWIDPGMFSRMTEYALDHGCGMVICGMKLVYPDRTETYCPAAETVPDRASFLEKELLPLYDAHLLTTHSNKLYDMEIIRREGLRYDPDLRINEDIDFVLRYLNCCPSVGIVREPYLNYLQHGAGQSLITTFQPNGIDSSLLLVRDAEALFDGVCAGTGKETGTESGKEAEPGTVSALAAARQGMLHRLLVHVLSFAGILYYRSPLNNDEKLAELRRLNSRADFRELLRKTKPQDLKTAAARFLLLSRQERLYHTVCRIMYRRMRQG